MPRRQIAWGGSPVMSPPLKRMRREVGGSPQMTLNIVVLPAPLGPMSPSTSPRCNERSTPSRACTPPKFLLIPLASRRSSTTGSGRRALDAGGAIDREGTGPADHQDEGDDDERQGELHPSLGPEESVLPVHEDDGADHLDDDEHGREAGEEAEDDEEAAPELDEGDHPRPHHGRCETQLADGPDERRHARAVEGPEQLLGPVGREEQPEAELQEQQDPQAQPLGLPEHTVLVRGGHGRGSGGLRAFATRP